MTDLKGKRIVMIIPSQDFRDEELKIPSGIFKKYNIEVKVASSTLGMVRGKLGMMAKPDLLYSDVNAADYDVVIFVGGPGSPQYWNDTVAHKIVKEAASLGKFVAAICAAPPTLGNAGILKGKRATCFPSEGEQLTAAGAKYTKKAVEVDENIVTADGPESAERFAEEIVKLLRKEN